MARKEFVMRGQTASGDTEVLNFTGHKNGYAYRLVEFRLFPSTSIHSAAYELTGTITAGKSAIIPTDVNFKNEGLIATALMNAHANEAYPHSFDSVVNDLFLITQNLILMVMDSVGSPINWQCRFISEKMSGPEEATANFKQFTISD